MPGHLNVRSWHRAEISSLPCPGHLNYYADVGPTVRQLMTQLLYGSLASYGRAYINHARVGPVPQSSSKLMSAGITGPSDRNTLIALLHLSICVLFVDLI